MRIGIIEDDQHLVRLIERVLTGERFTVEVAYDGPSGIALGQRPGFAALVLDVMLPGCDGIAVCRALRAARVQTPLLMLTARGSVEDRVRGLSTGADDYLVKPFAMQELVARIHALLRRGREQVDLSALRLGDVTLDLLGHTAQRGERVIEVTAKEFDLLAFLMRHPGQVLTRTQILDNVWHGDDDVTSNVVDIYVHYLRAKLGDERNQSLIKTVRGVGYRIAP